MPLALHQPTPAEVLSPSLKPGRKLGVTDLAVLWQCLAADPQCPSRVVLDKLAPHQLGTPVSVRHLNRLRNKWELGRPKGRPRRAPSHTSPGPTAAGVQLTPHVAGVGVHLFARWLEQQGLLAPLVSALQQAIELYKRDHRDADFALLHHQPETLLRRLLALLLAPLLGIKRLSELDTHEHSLATVIGRNYQSSTLTQFLGHLERIDVTPSWMPLLLPPGPTELDSHPAELTYIDGHMTPYWSRLSMHKGKITMLGRIMAGSQAVVAHNDAAQALFVTYYPPDLPLSQIIITYCQEVVMITGSDLFVIDRAVNSVAMARAFTEQSWGLLCMLDDNEHQGLSSFAARPVGRLDDGTPLYGGSWQVPRPDDPRYFVIVESSAAKTLVYWGTPRLRDTVAPSEWPRVYRERNEIQENGFKRMIDHGALNINYGRQTIVGPDRHQQRAQRHLEMALAGAQKQLERKTGDLETQQAKVTESEQKGHGIRLDQRREALVRRQDEVQAAQQKQVALQEKIEALGPPKERRDRDFGKQTIMTFRTLWLENALMAFLSVLAGHLGLTVSPSCLLTLMVERSGTRLETAWEVIYEVNGAGLSMSYRHLMTEMVAGLNAMDLREQGKPIQVRLKDPPP